MMSSFFPVPTVQWWLTSTRTSMGSFACGASSMPCAKKRAANKSACARSERRPKPRNSWVASPSSRHGLLLNVTARSRMLVVQHLQSGSAWRRLADPKPPFARRYDEGLSRSQLGNLKIGPVYGLFFDDGLRANRVRTGRSRPRVSGTACQLFRRSFWLSEAAPRRSPRRSRTKPNP